VSPRVTALQDAFREALRDLGYVEGKTIDVETRFANGSPERLSDLITELSRARRRPAAVRAAARGPIRRLPGFRRAPRRRDETIDPELAHHLQTRLADNMNGARLSIPQGAPCRLRVETQLGFKMVKYVR